MCSNTMAMLEGHKDCKATKPLVESCPCILMTLEEQLNLNKVTSTGRLQPWPIQVVFEKRLSYEVSV